MFFNNTKKTEGLKKCLLISLFLFMHFVVANEKPTINIRSIDAYTLDISGVKLGMSKEKVLQVLSKLKHKKDKTKIHESGENLRIDYFFDGSNLSVHLGKDVYKGTNTYITFKIEYSLHTTAFTVKNRNVMKNSILEKYGKYSGTGFNDNDHQWCKNPVERSPQFYASYPFTCYTIILDKSDLDKVGAYLEFEGNRSILTLYDINFEIKREQIEKEKNTFKIAL